MECYLGIDVSKGYADFVLLDRNKTELERVFQLDDNREGHEAMKKVLSENIERHEIDIVYCAVESTGGYENNWYNSLVGLSKMMELKVARLNPSGVRNNVDAGLKRNITDALSARYIAEYLISHPDKVEYDEQSALYSSFRSISKHIRLQNKQQTQLINQLKSLLYSSFPELTCYCKSTVPNWVLAVLKKYPTSVKLSKTNVEVLCKINHVTEDKANALLNKTKSTVASRSSDGQGFLIKSMACQLIEKQELIKELKDYLEEKCTGAEVDLVDSISGIGPYSAASIMVEIEDISRFESTKHLASFFGLHPELKDSGDKKPVHRMSKKGRANIRAILYMCAQSAVICDEHFKKIYHNQRQKGMGHKQAIGVIMHKMLRIIWGVLTHKKVYNSKVDKQNQEKKVQQVPKETEKKELKAKRRFSPLSTDAPISNRQNKKRKAHLEPQSELVGDVRDHPNVPIVKI